MLFNLDCPIRIKNLKNQKVLNNSNVLLECESEIDLSFLMPVEFKWKKNGIIIDTTKNKYEYIHDENIHQLRIFSFNESDNGDYEIFVDEPKDFNLSMRARVEVDYSIGNFEYFIKRILRMFYKKGV